MASTPIFPDEIMIEILLKLPIKSILRCNTLSKHYYSLIHSKFFIRRHLNQGRLNDNFNNRLIASPMVNSLRLFNRRSGCFMKLECSSSLNDNHCDKLTISGPIDGLYCVIDRENMFRTRGISLWNPATLEEFVFPLLPLTNDDFEDDEFELALDDFSDYLDIPEKCLACGFGYDSNTNNYKVVIIYNSVSHIVGDMSMYIFNVSEGTWRDHEEHLGVNYWRITTFVGVFVGGACHWICTFHEGSTLYPICCQILAFDMSMESSRAISFPDVGDGYEWSKTSIIATLNGCLAIIDANGEQVEWGFSSVNVWVMAEYGVTESWSIMYRVSLPHGIVGRFLRIIGNRFYVSEGGGWMVSYDLDSKDVENYGILDSSIYSLLPYEESLVRIISS